MDVRREDEYGAQVSDFSSDMSTLMDYHGPATTKLLLIMLASIRVRGGRWTWADLNDALGGELTNSVRDVVWEAAEDGVVALSDEDHSGVCVELNWREIYRRADQ